MKNRIIVSKQAESILRFYLHNREGTFWLFDQAFSRDVYAWFRNGRSESEIMLFSDWKRNKRLSKTIERIPREIRYVTKYVISDSQVA